MKRIIIVFLAAFILLQCNELSDEKIKKIAEKIHRKALTVDSHTDTPLLFRNPNFNFGVNNKEFKNSRIDIPRMESGGMDAVFFASFVGQSSRTEKGNEDAKLNNARIIEFIYRVIAENKDKVEIALSPSDAYRIKKEGKKAIFIGIENGYVIGKDLSLIEYNYNKGARYITLCHSGNNDICDSSTDTPEHHGLSEFGKEVVKEMNRVGMMIDVSHASDESLRDVLEYSKVPIIASHSCAKHLCDNPRNIPDELLLKLKENGGVIQICILSEYLKTPDPHPVRDSIRDNIMKRYRNFNDDTTEEEREKLSQEWNELQEKYPKSLAKVTDLVNHIDHVVQLIGINHVGIGSDFDGGGGIEDCFDFSQMGNITYELVKRGYSEQDIIKIWGGNLMRVFDDVTLYAQNQIKN